MIEIKHVHHRIQQQNILSDINLTIPKGGISALIGPNGAGKSTLFSLMARLNPLQSGDIYFDNMHIATARGNEIAQKVAILTQENTLHAKITVADLLMFGRYPYHQGRPTEEDRTVVEQGLLHFALSDYSARYLSELSGGQRQRALTAMVFCQSTDYLLLDEPLNNLDMYHARALMQRLRQLADDFQKTIVIVLHDINQAIAYADRIIAMQDGTVLFNGAPDTVITPDNVFRLFQVECDVITHKGIRQIINHR